MLWILLLTAIAGASAECYSGYAGIYSHLCYGPDNIECGSNTWIVITDNEVDRVPDCEYGHISLTGNNTPFTTSRIIRTRSLSLSKMKVHDLRWIHWPSVKAFFVDNTDIPAIDTDTFGSVSSIERFTIDHVTATSITGLPISTPKLLDLHVLNTPITAVPKMPPTMREVLLQDVPISKLEATDFANTSNVEIYIYPSTKMVLEDGAFDGIGNGSFLLMRGGFNKIPKMTTSRVSNINLDGNPLDQTESQTLPSSLHTLRVASTRIPANTVFASKTLKTLYWDKYPHATFPNLTLLTGLEYLSIRSSAIERINAGDLPASIKRLDLCGCTSLSIIERDTFVGKSGVDLNIKGTNICNRRHCDLTFLLRSFGTFSKVRTSVGHIGRVKCC